MGTGYFPVSYNESGFNTPEKDTAKTWFKRKLFYEHFIQVEGEDYFLAVDPLLNISAGREILQENTALLFQNTRGAQAVGQIGKKVSFYSVFYENQARFADFRSQYFRSRGELRYNNGVYYTDNATVPGGGRTKPFKENGFDYASSAAHIRFQPIKQIELQLGNTPQFIGWGHRSFLLSDNSFNFTNIQAQWDISPKLRYQVIRGKQLNLYRRAVTNQVEAPFERKNFGAHYLTFRPNEKISISVYEATTYLRDQAFSSQSVHPLFYNPVIGINSLVAGEEIAALKNLAGLNLGWNYWDKHLLYGQIILDNFNSPEYGFQLGWRGTDIFRIKNLLIQVEYNAASERLFSASNERLAYTHFNLPLAHTLGNGFEEFIFRASYQWKRIKLSALSVNYRSNQPIHQKTALFQSNQAPVFNNETTVSFNSGELSYIFNESTMLAIFVKSIYRMENPNLGENRNNGIILFGVRTGIRNQYMDF